MSVASVQSFPLVSHESEIHNRLDLPQRIIRTNSFFQINPIMKQLCLAFLVWAHHIFRTYYRKGTPVGPLGNRPAGRGLWCCGGMSPFRGERVTSRDTFRRTPFRTSSTTRSTPPEIFCFDDVQLDS